jgi:catechol 2,3-dioxygenase-like lactoylglutathione lyase family enzyme
MALHRLLGFRAAVPDPAAVAAFYGELGLVDDGVRGWTGTEGGGAVRLDEGQLRRPLSVEIGCDTEEDVAAIASRLIEGGADPRHHVSDGEVRVHDPASHVELVVQVADRHRPAERAEPPEPNAPGRAVRLDARAPSVFGHARPPRRLGHVVIGTPDIAATRDLLVDGLGLKVSDELPGIIAFLRCSPDHHNVALVQSPVPLLQHYSWECDDVDHVGHTATALCRVDPERHAWGLGRHFAGSNFYWYLRDPSGSFLELYSDMDRIEDDEHWETSGRTPFEFEHIANSWGPDIPLEFIEPTDLAALQAGWAATAGA